LVIGIFKECLACHCNLDVTGQSIAVAKVPELTQLPPERTFICPRYTIHTLWPDKEKQALPL